MKKTLVVIFILPIFLLVLSLSLNGITYSNIQKEHVYIMETLMPEGKDFVKLEYSGEDKVIRSVHKCSEGFIIEAVTMGYADEIIMFIGVDNDATVTGLVTYNAHETLGLGSRILYDDEFLSQFLNKSGSFTLESGKADSMSSATTEITSTGEEIQIDGISGATVSTKAVIRCVNSAIAYVSGADIESSATQ